MKKVALLFLIWIFVIFAINKLSVAFVSDRTSYELPPGISVPFKFTIVPFLNFDGRNYLGIATKGYYVNTMGQDLVAFFPLYPLLISFFFVVLKYNPIFVGLLISIISAFFDSILLYLITKREFGEKIAFRALLLFLAFPTSFFLISYYTESLFLLLILLTFWWFPEKNLFRSSLASSVASAVRFFGVLITPILIIESYIRFKKYKKFSPAVFLAPLGFIIYFIYISLRKHDIGYFASSYSGWGRNINLLGPIEIFINSFKNVIKGPLLIYDSPFVYPVIVIEFLSLLLITFIVIYSYKKIKHFYWLYIVFNFSIILFVSYPASVPRYLLSIFPIYILLAERLKGWKYYTVLTLSFCLMVFLSGLFLRGYWVS